MALILSWPPQILPCRLRIGIPYKQANSTLPASSFSRTLLLPHRRNGFTCSACLSLLQTLAQVAVKGARRCHIQKRQRAAALHDLSAVRMANEICEAPWSGAALCRFQTMLWNSLAFLMVMVRMSVVTAGAPSFSLSTCLDLASPSVTLPTQTMPSCFTDWRKASSRH